MAHVILRSYSKFFNSDPAIQFDPILDQTTGCFIAHAEVQDADALDYFTKNAAFSVLTDEEYQALTELPVQPEPTEPKSGDPLTDAGKESAHYLLPNANAENPADKDALSEKADPLAGGPPAPPSGKGK